jgi:hypothetical protein
MERSFFFVVVRITTIGTCDAASKGRSTPSISMKFGGHFVLFSERNQHHVIQAASIIVDPGGTDRRVCH